MNRDGGVVWLIRFEAAVPSSRTLSRAARFVFQNRDRSGARSDPGPGVRAALSPTSAGAPLIDMGNTASGSVTPDSAEKPGQATAPDTKPKKKICCACPDTKKLRDECIVQHGEEACGKWIEAHRQCLRAEGFNV